MTALTFNQALVKYRPDQARDRRGRFADEGGNSASRGAVNPTIAAARGRRHFNSQFKGMSTQQLKRIAREHFPGYAMPRDARGVLGALWDLASSRARDLIPSTKPPRPVDRGQQSPRTTPRSFWTYQADEPPSLEQALALGAIAPKTTWPEWEQLSPGMRREIVRSAQRRIEGVANGIKAWLDMPVPTTMTSFENEAVDSKWTAGNELMAQLRNVKMPPPQWRAVAEAIDMRVPKGTSSAQVKRKIIGRLMATMHVLAHRRSYGGRSAA